MSLHPPGVFGRWNGRKRRKVGGEEACVNLRHEASPKVFLYSDIRPLADVPGSGEV